MKTVIIKVEIDDQHKIDSIIIKDSDGVKWPMTLFLTTTETCEDCKNGKPWGRKSIECYPSMQICKPSHYCGYWEAKP